MTELFTFVPQPHPPLFSIALTGHPGAGKSTVLRFLHHLSIQTINIDTLLKTLYAQADVQERINVELLNQPKNQPLNRSDLRDYIQQGPNHLRNLEKIVHPLILRELLVQMKVLQLTSSSCIVVEIPLLFETGWHVYFDQAIVIKPDQIKQYSILEARGWSPNYIDFIISRFNPYSSYISQSDFIIENKYDISDLIVQIRYIMNQIKNYA